MSWLDGVRHRLGRLLRPGAFQRELDAEMLFHQDLASQAGTDALRFGNRTYYREETRRMTWIGALDPVVQDCRIVWRSIVHAPGFTTLVVATLALGLGGTAALFSLIDRLYLRQPVGIDDPSTLRKAWVDYHDSGDGTTYFTESMSYPRAAALARAAGDASRATVYFSDYSLRLGPRLSAPRVRAVYASESYAHVLGVKPALGRFFGADENRLGVRTLVAVVSHDFWRRHMEADSSAIGRSILIGRDPYVVIGVFPAGFTGLDLQAVDVWLPLSSRTYPAWLKGPWWQVENFQWYYTVVRLSEELTTSTFESRATQQLAALRLGEKEPEFGERAVLAPLVQYGGPGKPGQTHIISTRLLGVALIVLLISCANVINLLLARAISRRRETAVRLTLGISRRRLIRLFVLEAVVLALLAVSGAAIVAWWGGTVLRTLLLPDVEWFESVLHWRLMLFTVAAALASGLAIGILPAMQASQPNLTRDLSSGARAGVRRSRLRDALIVTQAALSLLLLTGAGLFVRSLIEVQSLDIGYDSGQLVFGEVRFEEGKTVPSPVIDAAMKQAADQLARDPSIELVARAAVTPMLGYSVTELYFSNGATALLGNRQPRISAVSPDFFQAAGVRILRGRGFSATEATGQGHEIVLSEYMAALLWPGREALGQCLRFEKVATSTCFTVVGIVENVNASQVIEQDPVPQYYIPLGVGPAHWTQSILVVRAKPDAARTVAAKVERAIRVQFPADDAAATPMTDHLEPEYRSWRVGATLFTTFGLLALVVAIVGIYSTVAYTVRQRTHEFGVRIALGARIKDMLAQVIFGGIQPVFWGVFVGVALTLAAGRLIVALLYRVTPYDPAILGSVALLLLGAAALASLVPAWRAARVDPVRALKSE